MQIFSFAQTRINFGAESKLLPILKSPSWRKSNFWQGMATKASPADHIKGRHLGSRDCLNEYVCGRQYARIFRIPWSPTEVDSLMIHNADCLCMCNLYVHKREDYSLCCCNLMGEVNDDGRYPFANQFFLGKRKIWRRMWGLKRFFCVMRHSISVYRWNIANRNTSRVGYNNTN